MTENGLSSRPDPSRRERKREQTATHLVATALRLFETHGYEAVTMEQIAADADVAKGTLYNYFTVKEALLAHQFREEIAEGMTAIQGALKRQSNFASRMSHLLRASAEWHKARRVYMPHYLRFRLSSVDSGRDEADLKVHSSGVRPILESLFRAGQEAGDVRSDHPASQLAWMFEFMCLGAVMVWLRQPKGDLNREFQFALDLLLYGIAVPATKRKKNR